MVLLAVVFVMAIGYAAFSQQLTINGTASIDSSWDVHIEDIAVNGTTLDGNNVPANRGVLYADPNTYTLLSKGSTIKNGISDGGYRGGGVRITGESGKVDNTVLVIDGATITNNKAPIGGGIAIYYATLRIIDGIISYNESTNPSTSDSGGLNITSGSKASIEGGSITNNKARHGFALMIENSGTYVSMTGGTISNNSGVNGAVTVWNGGSFVLHGGTIKNNTASSANGGIWVNTIESPVGTYAYRSGVVCGNKPSNSYETSSTCPS